MPASASAWAPRSTIRARPDSILAGFTRGGGCRSRGAWFWAASVGDIRVGKGLGGRNAGLRVSLRSNSRQFDYRCVPVTRESNLRPVRGDLGSLHAAGKISPALPV